MKKKTTIESEEYEDFLDDLSHFSAKEEEGYLAESTDQPLAVSDAVLNVGENVRKTREEKGLSLSDIAQRTGLDINLLREIEDGKASPPLGTIIKLAKSLHMKMGYFISGAENLSYTIVRKNDRKLISRFDSKKSDKYGYEFISLAPHKKDRHMEPFIVTLEPSVEEEPSTHDGQEFIYVLQGKMRSD